VSISQSLILVQATNDPAAEANIHTISFTSKFASEISPVRYYINPDTKKGYYFIGSNYQGFENTTPDGPTPIVANKDSVTQPTSNVTATIPASKFKPTQPVMNTDKTISNAYSELFLIINNKIMQPQLEPSKKSEKHDNRDNSSGIHVAVPGTSEGSPGGNQYGGEPALEPKEPSDTMVDVNNLFPITIRE
jgi:hypothetical protein